MPGKSEDTLYLNLNDSMEFSSGVIGDDDPHHMADDHTGPEQNRSTGNGNAIFTINSMKSSQRYLSNESLETNSSSESSSNPVINVQHRKDHEFIPTRMKQINVSKPAADPTQFTRLPSNPLLVSAQKQLMMVEEVKKAKESIKQPRLKTGDEEPDWQSDLSSWKNRRRKQSEEALQRVAEIKALEKDSVGISRSKNIGRKLSSLLYTAPEDDWSDLGLEMSNSSSSDKNRKNHSHTISEDVANSEPPPLPLREQQSDQVEFLEEVISSSSSSSPDHLIRPPVGVSKLNRQFSKPVVTYTQDLNPPPVRRKSAELSASMKNRLEAFIAPHHQQQDQQQLNLDQKEMMPAAFKECQPDQKFHEKLETFRKISEGSKDQESVPRPPKPPPLSSRSPTASDFLIQTNMEEEEESEHDDECKQNVYQVHDALEESYRSVLGEANETPILQDNDFLNTSSASSKAPPNEKPPPPPPTETEQSHHGVDDELDKQEREIIAGLEAEEREHKKYMEFVQSMKSLSATYDDAKSLASNLISQEEEEPLPAEQHQVGPTCSDSNVGNSQPQDNQAVYSIPKKRLSESAPQPQRSYNSHWLIQEAEQRRITEMQHRGSTKIPSPNPHTRSAAVQRSQSSPVYENFSVNVGASKVDPNPPSPPQQHTNTFSPSTENLYANLGPVPPAPPLAPQQPAPLNFQREQQQTQSLARLPGPQIPPRQLSEKLQNGGSKSSSGGQERMLSVSGKKKCSHCKEELGRGAAMIIESLRLFYHLRCFQCCVCHIQLGNGTSGTDVRVRNNKLHCQNCYSNDEGLKFSKV